MSKLPFIGERPPPVSARPKCLACQRPLRALFEDVGEKRDMERTLTPEEYAEERARRWGRITDTSKYLLDETRNLWGWKYEQRVTVGKRWNGQYGDGRGFFCGPTCAHRWANAVAAKLAAEDRQLVLTRTP